MALEPKPPPVGPHRLRGTGLSARGHTHNKPVPVELRAPAWLLSTKRTQNSSECLQRDE